MSSCWLLALWWWRSCEQQWPSSWASAALLVLLTLRFWPNSALVSGLHCCLYFCLPLIALVALHTARLLPN
jgi:hypothetical protein